MKKPNQRGRVSSASLGALAARAAEALKQHRFKEAVELFKPMIRQDPRLDVIWNSSLNTCRMISPTAPVAQNDLGP